MQNSQTYDARKHHHPGSGAFVFFFFLFLLNRTEKKNTNSLQGKGRGDQSGAETGSVQSATPANARLRSHASDSLSLYIFDGGTGGRAAGAGKRERAELLVQREGGFCCTRLSLNGIYIDVAPLPHSLPPIPPINRSSSSTPSRSTLCRFQSISNTWCEQPIINPAAGYSLHMLQREREPSTAVKKSRVH